MTNIEDLEKRVKKNLGITSDYVHGKLKLLGEFTPEDQKKPGKVDRGYWKETFKDDHGIFYMRYIELKNEKWVTISHLDLKEDDDFIYLPVRAEYDIIYRGNLSLQRNNLVSSLKGEAKFNLDGCLEGLQRFKIKKSDIEHNLFATRLVPQHACYMTTACVEHAGLSDNCFELETLRGLRDNYVEKIEGGKDLIREYYQKAPELVRRVKAHPSSDKLLDQSFVEIRKVVDLTARGQYSEAVEHYKNTMFELENTVGKH
ncbi:CFI-box-CTERM domain-containing protein [Nanoarchaeota archaeon]